MDSAAHSIEHLISSHRIDDAMATIRALLLNAPQNPEYNRLLGECHRLLGQHETALAAYQKALELHPGSVQILGQIGHTLFALERFEESIAAFQQVIRTRPQAWWAYAALANGCERLGQTDPQEQALKQALLHAQAAAAPPAQLDRLKSKLEQLHAALTPPDPEYYRARYPDVQASGLEPASHFLQQGQKIGRNGRFRPELLLSEPCTGFDPERPTHLIVLALTPTPDSVRPDRQLIEHLSSLGNLILWPGKHDHLPEFRLPAGTAVIRAHPHRVDALHGLRWLMAQHTLQTALLLDAPSSMFAAETCYQAGLATLALIPASTATPDPVLFNLVRHANRVIFATPALRQSAEDVAFANFGQTPTNLCHLPSAALPSHPGNLAFIMKQASSALAMQQGINEETRHLVDSGAFNAEFFRSSGFGLNKPDLTAEYAYTAHWARGLHIAKSRPGFNDEQAERLLTASHDAAQLSNITPLGNALRLHASLHTHRMIDLGTTLRAAPATLPHTAVHIHAHYIDNLPDLLDRFGPLRQTLHFLISTNELAKAESIAQYAQKAGITADIRLFPNRGRDIGPFFMALQQGLMDFELIGHFHLKGTPQLDPVVVRQWQDFLLDSLIGKQGEVATRLLGEFAVDSGLGLVFQEDPNLPRWTQNRPLAAELVRTLGLHNPLPEVNEYPTGNMFWSRRAALAPLLKKTWCWDDFPAEPIPYDGCLLHALERLTPVACIEAQFEWATAYSPAARRRYVTAPTPITN